MGTEWVGMVVERGTAEWAAQDSRLGQSPTGCIDQDPREGQNLAVGDCDWTSKRAWTGRVYRVDGLEGTGEYRMGRWNGRDWVWVLKTRAGCRAAASVSKSGLASGASRSPRQSSPAVLTNFDLSSEREGIGARGCGWALQRRVWTSTGLASADSQTTWQSNRPSSRTLDCRLR